LTGNGMVCNICVDGGKSGRDAFETLIASLGITKKERLTAYPQTEGKIEYFHRP
jgi:hypothetical protein